MKCLFYTVLEETLSMASQKKSAVVAGGVLNFGPKEDCKSDFAADLPPIANQQTFWFPQMRSRHRQKTVKKLIIFFTDLKTV
jgi:hypothetical protein